MIEISRITNQRYSIPLLICGSIIIGMFLRKPFDALYSPIKQEAAFIATQSSLPNTLATLLEKGEQYLQEKQLPQATQNFKEILSAHPAILDSFIRLGSIAFQEERYEAAVTYFRTALTIEPKMVSTYMRLGLALHRMKEYEKAAHAFNIVIQSAPSYAEAYLQLERVLMDSDKLDEAVIIGQKGIELAPQDIHAYLNLGHIYNKRGDTDLAIEMYKKALTIDNDFANANYNLGYTLRLVGKLHEAIPYLKKALALQPYYPDAHIALAQAYWSLNDFKEAWKHYYYRWQLHGVDPEKLGAPLWDGSDLTGKTILLYAEQGFGDTLQFIRFAKEVKKRGARIVCKVQDALTTLLSSYPYIDTLTGKEPITEQIDAQAALMSIPGIINVTPETIPAEIPYLKADAKLVAQWKRKLAHDNNLKVGICWSVDPQHELTKSPLSLRTFPLKAFAALATIPGVSFYSLQKTHDSHEFREKPASFVVNTFNPDFDETHGRFMDTAALIENLDVVISVDTAVIHIAGALGKPVWVLLPVSPDCRWYFEGKNTPWYPTMRMFRQTKTNDFETPMLSIKKELAQLAHNKKVKTTA